MQFFYIFYIDASWSIIYTVFHKKNW